MLKNILDSYKNKIKIYEKKAKEINNQIEGRFCLGKRTLILYILKDYLGDKCKVYCEIGVLFGGSLCYLMQHEKETTFIAIDKFNGYYDKKYDPTTKLEVNLDIVKRNIEKMNRFNYPYILIEGDSHDEDTIEKVKSINRSIDLLFIDGDHSENGVIQDFYNYKDFVSNGGFIIFDDYGHKLHPEVTSAINSINFDEEDFIIMGKYFESFIIKKKTKCLLIISIILII